MKKSELKQIIKEEIHKVLNEEYIKVKDIYYQLNNEKPKIGDWIMYPDGAVVVMNKVIYPDYLKGKLNVKKVVAASYPHTGIPKLDINKIPNSIKENIGNKYQVVFWDINYDEYPVKQLFNSEKEAEEWAENTSWEEEYYAYDEEKGGDYLEYRTRYFNPEDKENYYGYEVKQYN